METRTFAFDVGSFKCLSISDGIQPIDAELLPTFFAGSEPRQLRQALNKHGMSPDYYELQCNCLLIDTGQARVLIDSGGGPYFDPHLGLLVPGLARGGYHPRDIDFIVLTHGHRDHICGSIAQDGSMIFPNARHLMVRGEWEYWVGLTEEQIRAMAHAEDIRFAQSCLLAMQGQLRLIEAGEAIVPGITTKAAPGHTRNHISIEVVSDGDTLICAADSMDLPIHIENTNWHPAWDELPAIGLATRRKLLRQAVQHKALIHGFHFPFPGLGSVRGEEDSWRFEPYQTQAN